MTKINLYVIMITTATKKYMEVIKMSLTIFAQRMKQSRENKGLKQNELAKIVGVTPTTISAYEKSDDEGNGKKPTLENAQAIAKALGVSLDWLSGMSNNTDTSFAEFTAKDYFRSLVTVIMETSSKLDDAKQNSIIFNNRSIQYFLKKVNDLIKVYRNGSIPEDLFNVCIEKIINDYDNYTVYGNCMLDYSEAYDAEDRVMHIVEDPEAGKGMYTITVWKDYNCGEGRPVDIVVTQRMFDMYTSNCNSEEATDNGKHNPKEE